MPQNLESNPPNWDEIDDECQHIPLNCPWTITSGTETLTVIFVQTLLCCFSDKRLISDQCLGNRAVIANGTGSHRVAL